MNVRTNPTIERRRSIRLKANFPIEFRVSSESGVGGGVTQDIASDGICFTTPRFLPKDVGLLLTLQAHLLREPINTPAKVVWTRKLGYGDLYRIGAAFSTRIGSDLHDLIEGGSGR